MRRACIDIGSNTTRLLVADCEAGGLRELHQERAFTRIGQALRRDGRIGPGKLEEISRVVGEQLASAQRLGAAEVRCVATASVRLAANGEELVARIRERCDGLVVEVLSDEAEARLAFAGAARTLEQQPDGPLAVVDVGGGSSEVAIGEPPDAVRWWASLPLGSGELTDTCVSSDPPTPQALALMRERAAGVLGALRPPVAVLAVAVGGNAASLRRLVGPVLDRDAIGRALQTLLAGPAVDVGRRFALAPERVALMPGALVILEAAASLLGLPLQIGRGGLREGILLQGTR